jgi:hypothetical protein
MSDCYVDLSYRGLALARRVKLTQLRSSTGYVEMPTPMPVGTQIAIATDDGMTMDAIVAEIHEQVAGSTQVPGMLVRPELDGAAAEWWKARATIDPEELKRTDPMMPTTIVGKRHERSGADAGTTGEIAVPEIVDDGQDTGVMDAVDPDAVVEDDGKRTTMMDAVDLAALGLDPNARPSGEIAVVEPPPADDEPKASKKKRKKR